MFPLRGARGGGGGVFAIGVGGFSLSSLSTTVLRCASSSSINAAAADQVYQRKSLSEHVLLRPDSYVGAVTSSRVPQWLLKGWNAKGKVRPSITLHVVLMRVCLVLSLTLSLSLSLSPQRLSLTHNRILSLFGSRILFSFRHAVCTCLSPLRSVARTHTHTHTHTHNIYICKVL